MIFPLCTFLALLAVPTFEESGSTPLSPCPNVFMYEPTSSEQGRWYGNIILSTDFNLHSLWLKIELDNEAYLLKNWVGNVSTTDNKNFIIENADMQINPGPAEGVRFFVQYNPQNPTPKLLAISLNGKEICNVNTQKLDIQSPNDGFETKPVNRNPTIEPPRPVFSGSMKLPSIVAGLDILSGDNQNTLTTQQPSQDRSKPLASDDSDYWIGPDYIQLPNVTNSPGGQTVENTYFCGGTLVSHKHVITAAHCVTRKSSQRLVNHNTLTVYLGKHNLRTSVDGVQIRFVKKIFVNPNYNASTFSRDVAILELREPVTYSDWVRPACLWPDDETDLRNVIGKKGSVVGWGFDDIGVATEELSLVEMPVVSQETCLRSYSEFFSKFTSEYTYCAGYNIDGSSVCNGDSGGGMVFKQNGVWYLRGLVSLFLTRQNEYRCDPTHYVIFTDLAKFLPWIYDTISDF